MTDHSCDVSDEALDAFYSALLDDDAEALYERAPCGYLSTTPDGTIIKANGTFLTWTGYDRADLVGRKRFAQLLSAGGRIYHETHYAPMLQMEGVAREIALDIVRADGSRLPALVNSVLERDARGNPLVVRTAVFDATDRREYERELLRAKQRAQESESRARVLAQTLQQTLLPPAIPEIAGLDLAGVYRPAGSGDEIGGDFYDVFEVGRGDWVVVIGDVRGKGVEAAVVTALARYTVRGAAVRHSQPSQILETLNAVLLHHATERFCTVGIVRLRLGDEGWTATVSLGGHPLPVLRVAPEQPELVGVPGTLLGVLDVVEVVDADIPLTPGTALVLYTDGVTEGRSRRELFDDERLLASVAATDEDASTTAERILADVLDFQQGSPRDDIAVLVIHVPT